MMAGPLSGVRVVVTRPSHQATAFADAVQELGGSAVLAPLIQVVPQCHEAFVSALKQLDEYDALLVTSSNAVSAVWQCKALAVPQVERLAPELPCYVVGEATARAAKKMGWSVRLMPGVNSAQELCTSLLKHHGGRDCMPIRALYLRGKRASPGTFAPLMECGWVVDDVICYDTVGGNVNPELWQDTLSRPGHVVIALYSPSAVQVLVQECSTAMRSAAASVHFACIGRTTAEAAASAGLNVGCVAERPTNESLLQAIIQLLNTQATK